MPGTVRNERLLPLRARLTNRKKPIMISFAPYSAQEASMGYSYITLVPGCLGIDPDEQDDMEKRMAGWMLDAGKGLD